ncbi:outer dense fiber protein 3B isoform X3 [Chelonus insularis]|uniref:outer dense fiber protein 3B isoform X3 n=1 Tax=Chelonus insularis TaxID=460826 RepID=UPI001588700E|nr:outer dense fiber protein 3B isoform X3 [Chelonus insularis]
MSTFTLQKKPLLSCKSKGPGPAYKLPSLMGYEKHDPSRSRNPAFSIRSRHNEKDNITTGPGPNRYDTYHLTRNGPENPPAFSLAGRAKFIVLGFGPGPGAYHPEKCPPMNHTKRSPAFSLKPRRKNQYLDSSSPGPNAYIIPACLGPKIPHKKTIGAFTIAGRKFGKEESVGPGPNAYGNPNYDVIKKKYPSYSLKSRKKFFDQAEGPGPIYNTSYISGKRPPMFSFGVYHSECKALPITDMDNE